MLYVCDVTECKNMRCKLLCNILNIIIGGNQMSKELKMLMWFSLFVGILAALYGLLYAFLPIKEPVMWVSFVTLSMFFMAGSNVKDIPKHSVNAVAGYFWGVFCLWLIALGSTWGMYPSLFFGVFVSVFLCCAVHMGFFRNTILGCCPMAFAGFCVCFAVGGTNMIAVNASLVAGFLLGGIMAYSGKLANKLSGIESTAS